MKRAIGDAAEEKGSLSPLLKAHCEFVTFTPLLPFSPFVCGCVCGCVCVQTCVSPVSPYKEWLLGSVDVGRGRGGRVAAQFNFCCLFLSGQAMCPSTRNALVGKTEHSQCDHRATLALLV